MISIDNIIIENMLRCDFGCHNSIGSGNGFEPSGLMYIKPMLTSLLWGTYITYLQRTQYIKGNFTKYINQTTHYKFVIILDAYGNDQRKNILCFPSKLHFSWSNLIFQFILTVFAHRLII